MRKNQREEKPEEAVITVDEWLEELASVSDGVSVGGMTAAEMANQSGRAIGAVRKSLAAAALAGRLVVSRGLRRDVSGRVQLVPVYKIVKQRRKV